MFSDDMEIFNPPPKKNNQKKHPKTKADDKTRSCDEEETDDSPEILHGCNSIQQTTIVEREMVTWHVPRWRHACA